LEFALYGAVGAVLIIGISKTLTGTLVRRAALQEC